MEGRVYIYGAFPAKSTKLKLSQFFFFLIPVRWTSHLVTGEPISGNSFRISYLEQQL